MDDLLDLDFASAPAHSNPQQRYPRGRTAFDYLAGSSLGTAPVQQPARPPPAGPPKPAPAAAAAAPGSGDAFATLFGTSSASAQPPPLSMQARLERDSALKIGGIGGAGSYGGGAAAAGSSFGGLAAGGAPGGTRSGSTPALLQPTQRGASPSSASLVSPTSRTASPLSPSFPPPSSSSSSRAPAPAPSVATKKPTADVWDFDLLSTAVPSAKSPSPSPSPAPSRSPSATAPAQSGAPLFNLGFGAAPTLAAAPPLDEFDLLDAFAAPASARPSPSPSPSPSPLAAADAPRRAPPAPAPAASPPATAAPPPHILGHLVEMGFAPRAAAAALVASRTTTTTAAAEDGGWDLERALEVLVQGEGQAASGARERERDEWGDEGDVRVGRRRSWEREDDEEEARARAQALESRRREEQQRRRRAGAAAEDAPAAPPGSTRARARPDGPTPQPPQQQQPPQALDAARVLQDQAGDMLLSAQKLGFSMFKSANALLGEGKKALARRIEEQRAAAAAAAGAGAGAASGRESGREGAGAREGRVGEGGHQFPGRPRWWTEEMEREEQEDQRRTASARGESRAPQSGFRDDDDEVVPARPFADPPRARRAEPEPAAAPPPAAEYRSPFRRAKAPAVAVAEADLLSGAAAPAPAPARSTPSPSLAPTSSTRGAAPPSCASPSPTPSSRTGTPTPTRPPRRAPSTRAHLPVSPSALATATSHKSTGNAHFKLGRFGDATAAYSLALDALPAQWLGRVPLLNNRAQARLRSGEEKRAAEDCAEAVRILLPAGGGEVDLDLGALEADGAALAPEVVALYAPSGGAAPLDLKDQLGKALGRRAKALEALEKWGAARDDWERVLRCGDEVVLRGAGGAKMVGEGVARCRKVLDPPASAASSGAGPSSSSAAGPAAARPAAAAAASRPKPRPAVQGSGDAVRALQAQQAAAAAEDDARHALKDVVDARIAAWKGGKEANLRALIASLDKVLWPELGWKTVGMHELISEGQLKVRYVRAIAKLHPDKLNVANTTVEQRMVAALVFAALNDAWNGMK